MQKRILLFALGLALLVPGGCSTAHYRKSANKETYRIIAEKSARVQNMDPHFTIERTNVLNLDGLPVIQEASDYLGTEGEVERGAQVIPLEKALSGAVKYNRQYQSRKEQLYLSALALTLARHQFTPIYSGGFRGDYQVLTEQVRVAIDPITGLPEAQTSDAQMEERRVTGAGSLGANWLLRTGGRIAASFTTDFLRYLTGDPRTFTSSQLGATLVQPLWRGAGYRAALENLTQAERSVLYALREFTQFRKDFSVQVATAYYGVLQNRDAVRNSYLNLESSRKNAERTRDLAREGRVTQADLGRLEQQELNAEAAWINAVRSYKQSLDNFKVQQMGIPADANIVPDERDLERLQIIHPDVNVEESIQVALNTRLDYYNRRDQYEDTKRRVYVAANGLKAQIDLVAAAGINSAPETGTGFPVPDIDRYHWSAGLNVDLPLERKAQRNTYVTALIAHKQSERDLEQFEDQIKLQVREGWRALDQARRNHEISEIGVKIAERRVEEQNLRAELGQAKAQDQVDAQNDLISSKNQRTQALVGHTIARLQFFNNMGILYIKDNGQWEEVSHAKSE